jgi:hypothetical protein
LQFIRLIKFEFWLKILTLRQSFKFIEPISSQLQSVSLKFQFKLRFFITKVGDPSTESAFKQLTYLLQSTCQDQFEVC